MTPKRPDATCLIALRRRSPFSSGSKRCGSSPPSPLFDLRAEPVHRDGQGLVGLGADRSERHRAGDEARDDRGRRLDLVERDRRRPAVRARGRPRSVHERARPRRRTQPLERPRTRSRVVRARDRGLQRGDRGRVPLVPLAAAPPLVLAADGQVAGDAPSARRRSRARAARAPRGASSARPMPAEPRRRAGEVAVDERRGRGRPPRRSARRGSYCMVEMPILDITLSRPSSIACDGAPLGLDRLDRAELAGRRHGAHGVEREVRVHRRGAVAEQQREVVHLARLGGLDHQARLHADAVADEVLLHRGEREQRRDRRAAARPPRGR